MVEISLVVGDWSGDGHEKTNTFYFESSLSGPNLEAAYEAGSKKLGFDLADDVAADYQDYSMDSEYVKTLVSHGLLSKDEVDEGDVVALCDDFFAELWMRIAKLGNPALIYKQVVSPSPYPTIYISRVFY